MHEIGGVQTFNLSDKAHDQVPIANFIVDRLISEVHVIGDPNPDVPLPKIFVSGKRISAQELSERWYDNDNDHVDNINHSGVLQLPLVQSGTSVKSIKFYRFRAMLIDTFGSIRNEREVT